MDEKNNQIVILCMWHYVHVIVIGSIIDFHRTIYICVGNSLVSEMQRDILANVFGYLRMYDCKTYWFLNLLQQN